ncbi:carbohydrate ABC transporter permease [Paenibacillus elgii]|uniref:ABC transporter permease n=1 Tax=Paenibacillus elgii TaxID=189691 RepID=A0A165PLZ1_9BACL|nr:sugar ABC transporter permease [Paenibacillus elgii]KZE71659.1 ABC transporter permease [Paenibacillus elgii]NEN84018.1 sugar ABC transporter permease [Paenibacillus elgii]PUA34729.1 sugar ABC transporter permease [Paenibacillus elgii]
MKRWLTSQAVQQTVFIGPALLVYAIVMVLPFLLGLYYSFSDWNGVSSRIGWVGLQNYQTILTGDPDFGRSFWFTARFTVAVVLISNVLGFLIAYLLSKPLKTRNLLRTIFFMPNVLGGLLLGFIWQFIFTQSFASIGRITGLGFFNLSWLGTEATAFWALVIVSVWQGAGYLMVIYIAGLTNVPKDMLEAAAIDGATSLQALRHIVLPLIMPAVTVCLFLSISWAFKSFDLNFSLTQGGPYKSTESIAMNIYFEAFKNNRYGLGTAKAFVFFVVVTVITLIQVTITKKKEVEM